MVEPSWHPNNGILEMALYCLLWVRHCWVLSMNHLILSSPQTQKGEGYYSSFTEKRIPQSVVRLTRSWAVWSPNHTEWLWACWTKWISLDDHAGEGSNLLGLDQRAMLMAFLGSLPFKQPCAGLATLRRSGDGERGPGVAVRPVNWNSGCSGWLCHLEVSSLYYFFVLFLSWHRDRKKN